MFRVGQRVTDKHGDAATVVDVSEKGLIVDWDSPVFGRSSHWMSHDFFTPNAEICPPLFSLEEINEYSENV